MAKLQPGSGVSDELLTLVGKIAVQWSYVDFLVSEILSGFKGLDQNGRDTIRAQSLRGDNGKIRQTLELVEKISDQADKDNLTKWLSQISELAEDRNLVQHGIIVYKDPNNRKEPKMFVFRGKHKKSEQEFTKEGLEKLLKEISELSADLLSICEKYKYADVVVLKEL